MSIRPFTKPGEFDSETIVVMGEAFDAACKELDYRVTELVREVIAERIIIAAKSGERDPDRLLDAALAGLSREQE